MNIPSAWRGYLYIVNIALAVLAVLAGLGVVFFGWFTQEQVLGVVTIATAVYSAFVGYIARLNLTPDDVNIVERIEPHV